MAFLSSVFGKKSNKQSKQELAAGLQQQQQMLMQQKAMMQQQQTAGAQRKPFGDVGNQNKAPQQQAAAPMHTKKLEPMGFRAAPMMDNGPAPVDTAGAQPVVDYTCKPATSPLMEATCKLSDFGGELDERVQSLHDVHGHLNPHAVKDFVEQQIKEHLNHAYAEMGVQLQQASHYKAKALQGSSWEPPSSQVRPMMGTAGPMMMGTAGPTMGTAGPMRMGSACPSYQSQMSAHPHAPFGRASSSASATPSTGVYAM